MTIDEADAIIAELNICFPSKQLVVEEVKRWEGNLAEFYFDDAKRAVKKIEETSRFWPSWAEFREVVLPMHKQRLWDAKDREERKIRELEPAQTEEDKEKIAQIIKSIKQTLKQTN
jgi:hypothetical protein